MAPGQDHMARLTSKKITVEDLWRIERPGAPSLSPDGAQVVTSLTSYQMAENKSQSSLWLLSTLGGRPRRLTQCGDKDGQPRFSPSGHQIAFIARRSSGGTADEMPQLYLIATDGGEAYRAALVPTGVEAFRWCPDGRHIIAVSWVWPDARGQAQQASRMKVFKTKKETGYATSQAQYRYWDHHIPHGRAAHLLRVDTVSGKVRDLFEGTPYELSRADPDASTFDISPDGRHLVFAFDPASEKRMDGRFALAELDLRTGRIHELARDAQWDFSNPRYSPDGTRVAFVASHQGKKHTMPGHLAIVQRSTARTGPPRRRTWQLISDNWDHDVHGPLHWHPEGDSVFVFAEDQGRRHLWQFELSSKTASIAVAGGCVHQADVGWGSIVTLSDSASHPPCISVHRPGQSAQRIESFNQDLLDKLQLGRTEEMWIRGAQGDRVQVWLTFPPGFDPKRQYPLLHNIHGGPHTAAGDNWHFRWNTHVFAAQGYVVASVNYHGSSSFGYAFLDSITHRWGELELQDVEAATTALLRKPWIDRRRVFAAGGSYGGYMVAWMNAHVRPGRYRAYICHAGCFDWTAMFADDAWAWHAKELGAWYWEDMKQIHRQSPHAHARSMRTPTLVIHGALDYRVPDAQGLAYYNTLKALNVPARLLWFPDENHWILKPRNSMQWYGEFFDWLRQHDEPGASQARSRQRSTR